MVGSTTNPKVIIFHSLIFSPKHNSANLMFMDTCIIVQFIKKNATRYNNVSKFYYSIFM